MMPRLSDLGGVKAPDRCQCCSALFVDLERWREHDEADTPTATVVVLCKPCGKLLIDRHPRLYARMDPFEPHPGTMELCVLCRNRDGVACRLAKCHGGGPPGVKITANGATAHFSMSPRRNSGLYTMYFGPPKSCDRREVLSLVGAEERC